MKKPKETKRASDEAVKTRTGKVWVEWFRILDKAGARKMPHKEIAVFLHEKQGVPSWWCQMVAVEYEYDRGIRQKFQKGDGKFSASSSRTLAVPMAKIYTAWTDRKQRRRWLGDAEIEITSATPGKYVRAKWDGGKSRVSVGFYSKGASKTQVAVDHEKLLSPEERAKMKAYWSEAFSRLETLLQS